MLFDCVRSALSGHGKLKVNKMIRGYKMVFMNYTWDDWYDIANDYTIILLVGKEKKGASPEGWKIPYYDEFDSDKSSLQTWVNFKVLGLIQQRARDKKKFDNEKNEIEKKPIVFSMDGLEDYLKSDSVDAEKLMIIRETYEEIMELGDYIPAFTGEVSHQELAEEMGICRKTVYNNVRKLDSEINDLKGYLK